MESPVHLLLLIVTGFVGAVVVCQGPAYDCLFDPPAITEGDDTQLTCRFPENVKENTKNFFIQISNDSNFKVDADVVVSCVWPKATPGPSNCTMSKGYADPTINGFTFTTVIQNATKGQAGHYKCFVFRSQTTPISCHVFVFDRNRSDSEPSSETTIMSVEMTIGLAVGGCVVVVVILAILLIYCCLKRRNASHPNAQRGRRDLPNEEVEMLPQGIVRDRIQEYEDRNRAARPRQI